MSIFRSFGSLAPAAPRVPTGDYGAASYVYGNLGPRLTLRAAAAELYGNVGFNLQLTDTASEFYGEVLNTDVSLPWTANGTFDYWDLVSGVTINNSRFAPDVVYSVFDTASVARIAFSESLLNTTITFDHYRTNYPQYYWSSDVEKAMFGFCSDASGNGQALRIASNIDTSGNMGFAHTSGFGYVEDTGAISPGMPSDSWHTFKIHISSEGVAEWFYDGVLQESGFVVNNAGQNIWIAGRHAFESWYGFNIGAYFRNISVVRGIV